MSRIFTHVTLDTELITDLSPALTLLPSQARLAAAKPPMGFLNPFLYEHPQAFLMCAMAPMPYREPDQNSSKAMRHLSTAY